MAKQHAGNVGTNDFDPFRRLASAVIVRAIADLQSNDMDVYREAVNFLRGSMYPFSAIASESVQMSRKKIADMIAKSEGIDRSSPPKSRNVGFQAYFPTSEFSVSRLRQAWPFYRRGITVDDLKDKFPTEDAIVTWLHKKRWPRGIKCPRCDGKGSLASRVPRQYKCTLCMNMFDVRSASVMSDSSLSSRDWVIAAFALTTGQAMSSTDLMEFLDLSQTSCWRMQKMIGEMWVDSKFPLWQS